MMKVLVTRKIADEAISLLRSQFQVDLFEEDRAMTKEELISRAKNCDAVLTQLVDKIDLEVLQNCPNVKIFANFAVGYDNFELDYAAQNGVVMTNTPDVLSDTTAELALSLIFAVSRRITEAERYLREGKWKQFSPQLLLGQDIQGKRIGILGAGRIGISLAQKLSGFNMDVIYHNRSRNEIFEKKYGAQWVSFEELIETSDIITIHMPLNESTYHIIGKTEFKKMKKNVIIINTARGAVVDEAALINALEKGLIWGAGLDVYENEPFINPELLKLENVVLTPHIGSASKETRQKMAILAAKNIIEVLNGKKPLTPVY